MGAEIIVPVALFAMIAAMVVGPAWLKTREKRDMQETVRKALEQGQTLPPELVEAMSRSVPQPATAARDMRTGVLLIATALGIVGFGLTVGNFADEAAYAIGAFAAVPGAIGVAFVLLSFFNKNKG